jgi:hypothetical protein
MLSDVADVFLQTDDFATQIIRYVGGDEGNIKTFVGIVTLHPAMTNDGRGRGYDHTADVVFAEATELLPGDAIKHDGNRYEVKAVTEAEHGMKSATVTRYQAEVKGAKVLRNGDL